MKELKPRQYCRQNPKRNTEYDYIGYAAYDYKFRNVILRLYIHIDKTAIQPNCIVDILYKSKISSRSILFVKSVIINNTLDLIFAFSTAKLWGDVIRDREADARMLRIWVLEELKPYLFNAFLHFDTFRNCVQSINNEIKPIETLYKTTYVRYNHILEHVYGEFYVDYAKSIGALGIPAGVLWK